MNKNKKIVTAVVATVMAGTMVFSLAACGKKKPPVLPDATGSNQEQLTPTMVDGKLSYASKTTLNTKIGYQDAATGIKFDGTRISALLGYSGQTSTTTVNMYGKAYGDGSLKPAWQALQETLDITINDSFGNVKTDKQMETITSSEQGFAGFQVFTASAADINLQGSKNELLDISHYLNYLPNYKAFLDANPIVKLSLTAQSNGAMYMLPYFDGNDDIEKFVLLRKDLVETLLDGEVNFDSATVTFKEQAEAKTSNQTTVGTAASAAAYMGTTGSWSIDVTDPAVLKGTPDWGTNASEVTDAKKTKSIKVDYKAAHDAAVDKATALGAAVADAAGKDYTGESGNIIDLQNFAINETKGEVAGGKLLKILREYIKVAYKDGTKAFYDGQTYGSTKTKLSDVFNSTYAAWDVDLYVALGRCFVTCGGLLDTEVKETKDLFLLSGRHYRADRYNDTVSMGGELYGIRGLESRYQYTYIKADGTLADARTNAATIEALDKMSALSKEGLYNAYGGNVNTTDGWVSSSAEDNEKAQALSIHDYVQTQTAKVGFGTKEQVGSYNFAPVLTPVSQWDTDDDGKKDTTMRFTESWRGVKNTGWCISFKGVKDDPDKLAAALAMVDYFFSNDGQILMTYGPQSTQGDAAVADFGKAGAGSWYGKEVTNAPAAATEEVGGQLVVTEKYKDQYFTFNNKVYTGTFYNGRQIPTLTTSYLDLFNTKGGKSFTNTARYYLGSALNIGNKDQGFEYQCTATCGLVGSQIVNIALNNGTIKHTVQQVPTLSKNSTNWYTLAPTMLPYDENTNATITEGKIHDLTENVFYASSSGSNLFIDIVSNGLGADMFIRKLSADKVKMPADVAACLALLNDSYDMNKFAGFMAGAWTDALKAYDIK